MYAGITDDVRKLFKPQYVYGANETPLELIIDTCCRKACD